MCGLVDKPEENATLAIYDDSTATVIQRLRKSAFGSLSLVQLFIDFSNPHLHVPSLPILRRYTVFCRTTDPLDVESGIPNEHSLSTRIRLAQRPEAWYQ